MADKVQLGRVDNIDTAEDIINNNSAIIEEAFDNTVSRDGTTPNFLTADLDVNSQSLINLRAPVLGSEPVTLGYFEANVGVTTPNTDFKVLVSAADTTTGFLSEKIASGSDGIAVAISNPAADEDVEVSLVFPTDAGLEETVSGLQVKDGEGISVDTVGVNMDIPSLDPLTGVDLNNADTFVVYDTSALQHKEITLADLATGIPSATVPDATTVTKGIARYATQSEVLGGTENDAVVLPVDLKAYVQQKLNIQYSPVSGTSGQSFPLGSWSKANLTTTGFSNIIGGSVTSSVITLPAGDYEAEYFVKFGANGRCQCRLRDTSNNVTLGVGSSETTASTTGLTSQGSTTFTLAGSTNIELQAQTSQGSPIVAPPADFGETELYHQIKITKLG